VAAAGDDYDYIIRLIQYLDRRHGIRFFIGSRDFDVLYRWWEKRVPEALVRECIDRVVERFLRRQRPLTRFSSLSTEVRRGYEAFLALAVGGERPEPVDEHAAMKSFMAALPVELEFARNDLAAVFQRLQEGMAPEAGALEEKLLARFAADGELNAKTAWFLNNLAPPLRRPEIERRYRLNYLMGKFAMPPLE
jgi:hypothetical protein